MRTYYALRYESVRSPEKLSLTKLYRTERKTGFQSVKIDFRFPLNSKTMYLTLQKNAPFKCVPFD